MAAEHLQTAVSGLFESKTVKDAHIFAWMVALHMHEDLEDAGEWSLNPLYTEEKLSSIFKWCESTLLEDDAQRGPAGSFAGFSANL